MCTPILLQTDSLGEILDLRDKTTCPNLINISSYHASKVKQLLLKALETQIEVLRNTLVRSGQEARDEDDEEEEVEDEEDSKRTESEKLIKELQQELKLVHWKQIILLQYITHTYILTYILTYIHTYIHT